MVIQCPKCGRSGTLPGEQVWNTHALRCRKCDTRFMVGAVPLERTEQSIVRIQALHPASPALSAIDSAITNGFFSGNDDDDDLEPSLPDPADSHYELPVANGGDEDVDFDDWSTDDIPARPFPDEPAVEPASVATSVSDPWYYKLIHAWGRAHFFSAIGFAALSLTAISCLVLARLTGNLKPESSALAVVVGIVAAIALLMISLSTTALNLLLIDLARNIHRLRVQADHNAKIVR
jgi:hypothetical protein